MAVHVDYWEFDPSATITCPACGWAGVSEGNIEPFEELLDVRCASCGQMLLIVPYPTLDETKAAAAAGNAEAAEALENWAEENWADRP